MNLTKFINGIKLRTVGLAAAKRVQKTDLGIVKVAFMVAALDGDVSDTEIKALDALLKKCRGCSPKVAARTMDEAMRSAGYLMLLSRRANDATLVRAFVAEAQAALPNGFAYLSIDEVRRAIVTWMAMGLSDGEYSRRERLCIEKLRQLFAELKVMRLTSDPMPWLGLGPAITNAFAQGGSAHTAEIISKDFVSRVEGLIANYGDDKDAAKVLEKLIRGL